MTYRGHDDTDEDTNAGSFVLVGESKGGTLDTKPRPVIYIV